MPYREEKGGWLEGNRGTGTSLSLDTVTYATEGYHAGYVRFLSTQTGLTVTPHSGYSLASRKQVQWSLC